LRDACKIGVYLESKGVDMTFFTNVMKGTQDPWEKLKQNDVHNQMFQFKHPALKT
jgi:hypothetical protein